MPGKYAIFLIFSLLGCADRTITTEVHRPEAAPTAATAAALPIELPDSAAVNLSPKTASPVKPFGAFMKVKGDGEHCWGYDVEFWTQDDKFYGLISVHRGLCGDPPAGRLENIQFDPQTKKLSFSAKVSISGGSIPSRDVLEFEGFLTAKRLHGTLKTTDRLCPDKCIETKTIDLPRSKEWSSMMDKFESYEDWEADMKSILNSRGPRW